MKESVGRRGHALNPQPSHRGDAAMIREGWTGNFVEPNVDLSFSEHDKGPVNIPGHITGENMSIDFSLLVYWGQPLAACDRIHMPTKCV